MRKLYAVVTGKNGFEVFEPDEPCEPPVEDQTISVFQGLKMMTIEAAYALHIEERPCVHEGITKRKVKYQLKIGFCKSLRLKKRMDW
jgi:hypothetical protein